MTVDQMRVLPIQIPRAVRVASAPRYRAPTVVLEPDSMVSHAYRQLAHHILGSSDDERGRAHAVGPATTHPRHSKRARDAGADARLGATTRRHRWVGHLTAGHRS